jgi:hypothetical protein
MEPAVSGTILGSLECRRTAQVRNPRLLRALIASCAKVGACWKGHGANCR